MNDPHSQLPNLLSDIGGHIRHSRKSDKPFGNRYKSCTDLGARSVLVLLLTEVLYLPSNFLKWYPKIALETASPKDSLWKRNAVIKNFQ